MRSLSRNGRVASTVMPGQPERLAQPRREQHVRLPQALDLVDPGVPGQPLQGRQHRAFVGEGDVLVVRERHSAPHPGARDGGWSPTPITVAPTAANARVKYAISAG